MSVLQEVRRLIEYHLRELDVFSSSCASYLKFLKKQRGCPYHLYSFHIEPRWGEMQETWYRVMKDHEAYSMLLYDCVGLTSVIRPIPHERCKAINDYVHEIQTKIKPEYTRLKEYTFQQYRKLQLWITRYITRLNNLTEKHVDDWPNSWKCTRHRSTHECGRRYMRRHHNKQDYAVPPLDIGGETRIEWIAPTFTKQDVIRILKEFTDEIAELDEKWYNGTLSIKDVENPSVKKVEHKPTKSSKLKQSYIQSKMNEVSNVSRKKQNLFDVAMYDDEEEPSRESSQNQDSWNQNSSNQNVTQKSISSNEGLPVKKEKRSTSAQSKVSIIKSNDKSVNKSARESWTRLTPNQTLAPTPDENISAKEERVRAREARSPKQIVLLDSTETLSKFESVKRKRNKENYVSYAELDHIEEKRGSSINSELYIPFSIPVATTWMDKRFSTHNKHHKDMKKLEKMNTFDYSSVIDIEKYLSKPTNVVRHSWSAKGGLNIKKELLLHTK